MSSSNFKKPASQFIPGGQKNKLKLHSCSPLEHSTSSNSSQSRLSFILGKSELLTVSPIIRAASRRLRRLSHAAIVHHAVSLTRISPATRPSSAYRSSSNAAIARVLCSSDTAIARVSVVVRRGHRPRIVFINLTPSVFFLPSQMISASNLKCIASSIV